MKMSECLVGEKVVLVPYLKEHVPKYHEWMQNSYIQEMTESEPLTLEEEYEMQKEWTRDARKCTFIVIEKSLNPYFNHHHHHHHHHIDHHHHHHHHLQVTHQCNTINTESSSNNNNTHTSHHQHVDDDFTPFLTNGMCGDVNLFLHEYFEPEEHRAEIEVMIAEESARRKGIATEAVQLMMEFGHSQLQLQIFEAKILETNLASIHLFENRLKFKKVKYQQVFQEFVFEYHYQRREEKSTTMNNTNNNHNTSHDDEENGHENTTSSTTTRSFIQQRIPL
ncbi:hypothetical protein FDP41_006257 [Naegleria fowleri]|uniref:N-acetyltransferase domain-containing protein n=1 Tax=Naegleria fowleri TaxID=5763 RepID=A0A6A5B9B0_NAEFO|nr:uncharacterized protein FDP41_006257 [Naegleria fowleri]KAF0974783.1 hypothetical protein FDP41_006257 [Naegleria fowleri]